MTDAIDLHIHSNYSCDGEHSPAALVQMCADTGIKLIAIADHNCVKGVDEAVDMAKSLNIVCCPAIEADCSYGGINFHVLGYEIDHKSSDFESIEQNIRSQCIRVSKEKLKLFNSLGFDITEEEIMAVVSDSYWKDEWTGEAFAEALLTGDKHRDSPLLLPYREGGSRADNPFVNFYWDYCSQGKACYVPVTFPGMKEIIDLIHQNKGCAVLAHPGVNLNGRYEMVNELIRLGLDGLEAYSSYHDSGTARWFYEKAIQHGLRVTRGSDFHGKTKPSVKLGCCEK